MRNRKVTTQRACKISKLEMFKSRRVVLYRGISHDFERFVLFSEIDSQKKNHILVQKENYIERVIC
jgi:hypothetical protein